MADTRHLGCRSVRSGGSSPPSSTKKKVENKEKNPHIGGMNQENSIDPDKIKAFLEEMCEIFGDEFVVIGGWAVHAHNCKAKSFDGDAMISYAVEGTLRDSYLVTKNARMKKSQFICEAGCDIDLYVEHQHGLRIPFEEVQAYSKLVGKLRVATEEHLLLLKLDAFKDRRHTPKGRKDAEDLLNMLAHLPFNGAEIFEKHLEDEDRNLLAEVVKDKTAAMTLCKGNAVEAKDMRQKAKATLETISGEKQKTHPERDKNAPPDLC